MLFHQLRRPLSVMEVARALGWPQSSTTELLHTLREDGFLTLQPRDHKYFPSIRLGMLGSWVCQSLFTERDASMFINRLHQETGHSVFLTMRNDIRLEVLDHVSGTGEFRFYTRPGEARVITRTAMGHTLLASYDDRFVELLVRRVNALRRNDQSPMRMQELKPVLEAIRKDGYRYAEHSVVRNSAILAALVPAEKHEDRLVVGIAGQIDVINAEKNALAELLRTEIDTLSKRVATRAPI